MAAALVTAVIIPFELFLLAYAVLGPLHYLTEINWLNTNHFHLEKKNLIWLPVTLTLIISIPALMTSIAPSGWLTTMGPMLKMLRQAYPYAVILCLVMAVFFVTRGNRYMLSLFLLITGSLFWGLRDISPYYLLGAVLLPTVVHVYLFTITFMIYGLIKEPDHAGTAEVIMLILTPAIIYILPSDWLAQHHAGDTLTTFRESGFGLVVTQIGRLLRQTGWTDTNRFMISDTGIRIQIFIAFAYTYHYLNWFSKVSLIGWLKRTPTPRITLLTLIWLASMGLYWYDYQVGLGILFTLSLLHVTVEFPLNIQSIQVIARAIYQKQDRI